MTDKRGRVALLTGGDFKGVAVPRMTASVYEAAAMTRRTIGWKAPTTYPN